MMGKTLMAFLIWLSPLISVSPALAAAETELWENEAFVKKAQAIKRSNWNKVQTRDLAIVMLFEFGRKADEMESYLKSRSDRFTASVSSMVWIVGGAVGAYLVLQLMMTFFMVTKLGRLEKAVHLQGRQGTEKGFDL